MPTDLESRLADCRSRLQAVYQEHVLTFWSVLSAEERAQLLADVERLPFSELTTLSQLARKPNAANATSGTEPAVMTPAAKIDSTSRQQGARAVSEGKVAALTVAGGQGTRLGFDGPKGAFPISPVKGKYLFQLFAEQIQGAEKRYDCRIPWYIMTSAVNDSATQDFFRHHRYFSMRPEDVMFFQQGLMPAFDSQGKILLDQKFRISLSPDGHGGSLLALARSGMLEDMSRRGVEFVSYFQVDNPLVICIDPAVIGLHAAARAEMSSKAVCKADDLERVGNFVMEDGKLAVIEYSDLPDSLAHQRNPDGSRRYDAANIAIHVLSRAFIERLTADAENFALPWHRAVKKVPFIDLQTGQRIEPAAANGIKLESFIFDALPLSAHPVLMETTRSEEFSPVKNAEGIDSVATAKRDMNHRAARWLTAAGWSIPRRRDGEIDGTFEISPLVAQTQEDFINHSPAPRPVNPGEAIYIE